MSCEDGHVLIADNGTPVRLSPSAYLLLRTVESGASFETIATALSRPGRPVTAAEVERCHERLTNRIRSVEEGPGPRRPKGFLLRWRLLPQPVVSRIASRLAVLFASPWVPAATLAVVLTAAVLSPPLTAHLRFESFWPAYLLFIASLLAHELGHSSACARFGARPSDIGVAIYLISPAFYSDVTRAWELDRRQRVVVDLGGVYLQLIVGALYALTFAATGWAAWLVAFKAILLSCLVSLTPIFRLDGYWVLVDALGLDRLDREPGRLLGHLAERLRGRRSRAWPWSPLTTSAVAFYSVFAIAGWIYLICRLTPEIGHRVSRLPAETLSLIQSFAPEYALDAELLRSFLFSTLLVFIWGLMIRQLFQRAAKWFGQALEWR